MLSVKHARCIVCDAAGQALDDITKGLTPNEIAYADGIGEAFAKAITAALMALEPWSVIDTPGKPQRWSIKHTDGRIWTRAARRPGGKKTPVQYKSRDTAERFTARLNQNVVDAHARARGVFK